MGRPRLEIEWHAHCNPANAGLRCIKRASNEGCWLSAVASLSQAFEIPFARGISRDVRSIIVALGDRVFRAVLYSFDAFPRGVKLDLKQLAPRNPIPAGPVASNSNKFNPCRQFSTTTIVPARNHGRLLIAILRERIYGRQTRCFDSRECSERTY